jgi:asparagine synthase (glutamine-hydrolysing)
MAGLFIVNAHDPEYCGRLLSAAQAQFARHGFGAMTEIALPGWRLLHAPHILGGPESLLVEGDDLVAVAGTLTCDGAMGRPALEALLRNVTLPEPDWRRLGGHFAALIRRNGRTFLLTDYFAAFQLFHDPEMRFFSTSLLAAAEAMPRLSFDPQAVYEIAFNVVPIGNATVFREIQTLGPERMIELAPSGAVAHSLAKPLPDAVAAMPMQARVERHLEALGRVVDAHVGHFGDHVHCPLSGGLDSRLLLAALRARGSRPHVYVYGGADSEDVAIARRIGAAEGMDVEWIDKGARPPPAPDAFAEQVERNFQDYDGLPVYGELFENGSNAAARDARHAGGALAASGGCGEVYRNFFFLPDRPASAASVARTFFARYDRRDTTEAFDEPLFLRGLEDKILAALALPGERGRLPRALVEQIYPRVRCRSFFGREISLEGRYGAYLMPFLDHQVVAEAMRVPMALKNAGRFEAMLIDALDPRLASLPSSYGHDFSGPPNARHRLSEWATRIRPAWLRQRSYALRRRIERGPAAPGGLMHPDYLGRTIDLDFPVMRRFFKVERITDEGLLQRVACLEYLAQRLGSRLSV